MVCSTLYSILCSDDGMVCVGRRRGWVGASEDATIKKSQNYSPREELTYTAPAKQQQQVLHFV